eukprot:GFKZ01012561.1.p1 GENE.GFKZ01012561.1~~GFKZ01012561.1.p1  ORF type:complete len:309 (+),score=34.01 GFKZ01012561.1:98-928(+)
MAQAFISPSVPLRIRRHFRPSLRPTTPLVATTSPRTMTTASITLPPRVTHDPLPNVYIYEHCPYCVRVRHALGLKNVKHNLIWLLNDDISTPTSIIGKKMVPIFQTGGVTGPGQGESLDIIAAVDSNPAYGPVGAIQPFTGRTDITEWFQSIAMPLRRLTRIRFSRAPLPEFAFQEGRDAFIRNHPLPDPSDFDENFANSAEYIEQVQAALPQLAELIWSKEHCSEGGFSYDDIDLFARVRAMTIIKGLELPPKLREYAECQAEASEIPLLDYIAF